MGGAKARSVGEIVGCMSGLQGGRGGLPTKYHVGAERHSPPSGHGGVRVVGGRVSAAEFEEELGVGAGGRWRGRAGRGRSVVLLVGRGATGEEATGEQDRSAAVQCSKKCIRTFCKNNFCCGLVFSGGGWGWRKGVDGVGEDGNSLNIQKVFTQITFCFT